MSEAFNKVIYNEKRDEEFVYKSRVYKKMKEEFLAMNPQEQYQGFLWAKYHKEFYELTEACVKLEKNDSFIFESFPVIIRICHTLESDGYLIYEDQLRYIIRFLGYVYENLKSNEDFDASIIEDAFSKLKVSARYCSDELCAEYYPKPIRKIMDVIQTMLYNELELIYFYNAMTIE